MWWKTRCIPGIDHPHYGEGNVGVMDLSDFVDTKKVVMTVGKGDADGVVMVAMEVSKGNTKGVQATAVSRGDTKGVVAMAVIGVDTRGWC